MVMNARMLQDCYSFLNADTAVSLDALHAGYVPAIALSVMARNHVDNKSWSVKIGRRLGTPNCAVRVRSSPIKTPDRTPMVPPSTPIITDSARISRTITQLVAPIAFRIPNSLVLSVTEVNNVVTIPTAP